MADPPGRFFNSPLDPIFHPYDYVLWDYLCHFVYHWNDPGTIRAQMDGPKNTTIGGRDLFSTVGADIFLYTGAV